MRNGYALLRAALMAPCLLLAAGAASDETGDLFAKAGDALKSAQFDAAIEAYGEAEKSSKTVQSKAEAANGAGYVNIRRHRFADALPHLKRAVSLNPEHKVAWNNLGFCHLTLYESGAANREALAEALEAFEKVSSLDSSYLDVSAKISLVKAYIQQEEAWAAASAKRAGQSPRTVAADGTYKTYKAAGEAAEMEGDFALATANFEKAESAAQTKRGKSAAANFQGLLALKTRDSRAAITHLKRAVTLNPSNKYAWNNLGAALLRAFNAGVGGKELVEEAIAAFRKVAEIDSSYKPENLGMAEKILEEVGGAKAAAETAQ